MQRKKIISKTVIILCCIMLAAFFIFPILLLFINSFKSLKEIYMSVLQLPETLNLDNYISAFKELDYLNAIKNSLIVTCTVTAANVICCSMAAWVLVRYKTKTSKLIFTIFSVAVLVPFQCVMLPLLAEMGKLNMINMPGLMLVNLGFGSSMSIILFHGFMKNVPVELEEAAAIDGASQPRIFFTIVLPLIKGIAVTVAILNVMSLWNDYLLPYLLLGTDYMTIPIAIQYLQGGYGSIDMGAMMAMLVLAMVPIIIFYLLCQKHIIKGVAAGAVKG